MSKFANLQMDESGASKVCKSPQSLPGETCLRMPLWTDGELDDKPPHFRAYHEGRMHHEGGGFKNPSSLTDEQMRDIIRYTYVMITLVDDNVGRILNTIDAAGLLVEFQSGYRPHINLKRSTS